MCTITLWVATAVIAALGWAIWSRTRNPALPIGLGFLYYWSLYGSWSIIADREGGSSGMNYSYLEQKLFPISLDQYYLETIAIYGLFIIAVEVTILALVRFPVHAAPAPERQLRISHRVALIICGAAGVASWFTMRDALSTAWSAGVSGYVYTRALSTPLFSLHQELNRVALTPAAACFAILCCGGNTRFAESRSRGAATWCGYALHFGGMVAYLSMLGNKNELVVALIVFTLVYVLNSSRPNWTAVGFGGVLGLMTLYVFDMTRGLALADLAGGFLDVSFWSPANGLELVRTSNEAYGAHFSLYGALSERIPIAWGYSFFSLLASVVPRALWAGRPDDIYVYYVTAIHAVTGQGYSIHHATGWYLTAGLAGIPAGGALMGWILAHAHNRFLCQALLRSPSARVWAFIAPASVVANMPALIRVGIEGYKGFILEAILIPLVVLTFAVREARPAPPGEAGVTPQPAAAGTEQ